MIPKARFLSLCLAAGSIAAAALPLNAQAKKPDEAKAQPPAASSVNQPANPPQERSSATQHTIVLNGRSIHYTATAGTLLLRNDQNQPIGSIF